MAYALDLTASLAANFITGTFNRPASGPWIFKMPGGSFYTKDLLVKNTFNDAILQPGTQFRILNLNAAAVDQSGGKEVCDIILITDNSISQVSIKRRVIGGSYEVIGTDLDALVQAGKLDATIATTWGQVVNEPEQYPPEMHPHFVEDITGLDNLVYATDRIAAAIQTGDSGLFGAFYQYINQKMAALQANTDTRIAALTTSVNSTKDLGKFEPGQVVFFTDNSDPKVVFNYGRWSRLPDGLVMMTSDNAKVGTKKKIGEGSDYMGVYYAAWVYLGD